MKTIRVNQPYIHQGVALHPKLAYAVEDAVANGLVGLRLASLASLSDAPDLTLPGLTWEAGTIRADQVAPAPVDHPQS